MANNPLYPGYFPGQNIPNSYGGGGYTPQSEYNPDYAYGFIDRMEQNYEILGAGFPAWAYQRVMDDWKQGMKVSISGAGVSQMDLDDYDPQSLPGAFGIEVNLDPREWAKDPGKMAKKTLKGWADRGINWQDIETRYRQKTWKHVFEEDASAEGLGAQWAVAALGANIGAQAGLKYSEVKNPLSLENRGIYADKNEKIKELDLVDIVDPTTGAVKTVLNPKADFIKANIDPRTHKERERSGTDVMKDFAEGMVKYEQSSGFGAKREGAHDNIAELGVRAVITELEQSDITRSIIGSDKNMANALLHAQVEFDVYQEMDKIGSKFGDYTKSLSKAAVNQIKINPSHPKFGTATIKSDIETSLSKIDARIANLEADGHADEARYLRKFTEPFKRQTNKILELDVMDPSKAGKLNVSFALNELNKNLNGGAFGRALNGGSTFSPSIPRTLLRNIESGITNPGLRKDGLSKLVHATADKTPTDKSLASIAVIGGLNFVKTTADINKGMDLVDAIERGNFAERYIWKNIYYYFPNPGEITGRFLERHNFMGLKIADDARFEKSLLYKSSHMFRGKDSAPNGFYGNWFKMNQTVDVFDEASGAYKKIKVVGKLYGGAHFKAVDQMNKMASTNAWSSSAFAHFLTVVDVNNGLSPAENIRLAMERLKDKNSSFYQTMLRLNHNNPIYLASAVEDAGVEDFLKNIQAFKLWLAKNKNRLGITVDETDPNYYMALFKALKRHGGIKDNLDITKKYAGALEKVFSKFNKLQTFLFESKLMMFIAPAGYFRYAFTDRISAIITKILSLLASGASAGFMAPIVAALGPVIRFAVKFVLDKVVDIAQVFYNAVAKADIDGVFDYVDRIVEAYAKVAVTFIGLFVMLIMMPTEGFMGAVATTFSPVDNTLVSGVGDAYGSNILKGLNNNLEPPEIKPSSSECFEFVNYNGIEFVVAETILKLESWPDEWKKRIDGGVNGNEGALQVLQKYSGGFLDRLCQGGEGDYTGPIQLVWAMDDSSSGFCGIAAADFFGKHTIFFGHNKQCYSATVYPEHWFNHLFAHETGHIYDFRVPNAPETINGFSFLDTNAQGEGPFRTYPGKCAGGLDADEDFAETIGNWVQIDTSDCSVPETTKEFWDEYPKHYKYADEVLTRPLQ